MTPEERQRLREAGAAAVADHPPLTPSQVARTVSILRTARITRGGEAIVPNRPDIRTTDMIALREEGWSYQAIADAFGVSRQAVMRRIQRAEAAGFKVKHPSLAEERRLQREERRREAERRLEEKQAAFRALFMGKRFGTLVVEEVTHGGHGRGAQAVVVCDCGVRSQVLTRNLNRGYSTTCGSKVHHIRGWSRQRRTYPSNVLFVPETHP
jgi:transposase